MVVIDAYDSSRGIWTARVGHVVIHSKYWHLKSGNGMIGESWNDNVVLCI